MRWTAMDRGAGEVRVATHGILLEERMNYVIYDLETTGLVPRYDQPVQFAAVRLNDDLRETDAIELFARPQNHILPSPGALVTHGRGIRAILNAPLSHYAMMATIEETASAWGPATWAGYN